MRHSATKTAVKLTKYPAEHMHCTFFLTFPLAFLNSQLFPGFQVIFHTSGHRRVYNFKVNGVFSAMTIYYRDDTGSKSSRRSMGTHSALDKVSKLA